MKLRLIVILLVISACKEEPKPAPPPPAAPAKAHQGGQHENTEERAQEELENPLRVVVDGKELEEGWGSAELAKVKSTEENGKQVWSLREMVATLVGPKARVKTIVGQGGTRVDLDPRDWSDAAKTPMLKINRQGHFKLQWSGKVPKDKSFTAELREVTKLEISTEG